MSRPKIGNSHGPVARLHNVNLRFGQTAALTDITLDLPSGCMIGLIGPDGVGKSSLLSLIAGARAIKTGRIETLGGNMASGRHRRTICSRVAYMPQGLGRNLYPTLSVFENIEFFAQLFGQARIERDRRIRELLQATGLASFADRPVGKLSGGMMQKLGLCCALIHDPDLLILDEPTTGVDPLSRRQFWELIERIRHRRAGVSVVVATAYMEEAAQFDWLVALHNGRILATGAPAEILERTGTTTLEAAFITLSPEKQEADRHPVILPPLQPESQRETAIEARNLTMRFDDFVAVDHVSFRIRRGEIFGFIGSNGCGKTTTMKMLTGLLPATAGEAWLFGSPIRAKDLENRQKVGYMSQSFSLYTELSVRQNLELHARLFNLPSSEIPLRVVEMAKRFELDKLMNQLARSLSPGLRQRLSLAVAMIHNPEILILDEPTSGVDPVARNAFWRYLTALSRKDRVTIFISTHFMNEAERCDRIALMHAGRVLTIGAPAAIVSASKTTQLEAAFIKRLEEVTGTKPDVSADVESIEPALTEAPPNAGWFEFSFMRMIAHMRRESLELSRDPLRLALSLVGTLILMIVVGYGINLDVDNLTFAVLDQDHTTLSRDYISNLAGSRYFVERPPIRNYADLDRRMTAGELGLAIEIPPGFARDVARGRSVQIGAWIDGAMPARAETLRGYAQGIHSQWLQALRHHESHSAARPSPAGIAIRYRYNPDIRSMVAMVPGMLPILLLLIPAMLTAMAVVREKELGSIVNLYVTPTTRTEFLLGKQLPYMLMGMINFLLLTGMAIFFFSVPITGSFLTLTLAAFLYVISATAMGLVISAFMRSQIAAMFGAAILTLLPAIQFSGLINPLSSLTGVGAAIGRIYPTTYFIAISRGAFSKGLGFNSMQHALIPLALAPVILVIVAIALVKKQER